MGSQEGFPVALEVDPHRARCRNEGIVSGEFSLGSCLSPEPGLPIFLNCCSLRIFIRWPALWTVPTEGLAPFSEEAPCVSFLPLQPVLVILKCVPQPK